MCDRIFIVYDVVLIQSILTNMLSHSLHKYILKKTIVE
jgi:hypothetical protein